MTRSYECLLFMVIAAEDPVLGLATIERKKSRASYKARSCVGLLRCRTSTHCQLGLCDWGLFPDLALDAAYSSAQVPAQLR